MLLDGSGSVGDSTFRLQTQFARQLAQLLNISVGGSHLAIIQFSEQPQLEIALNQYTNLQQVGDWKLINIFKLKIFEKYFFKYF